MSPGLLVGGMKCLGIKCPGLTVGGQFNSFLYSITCTVATAVTDCSKKQCIEHNNRNNPITTEIIQ